MPVPVVVAGCSRLAIPVVWLDVDVLGLVVVLVVTLPVLLVLVLLQPVVGGEAGVPGLLGFVLLDLLIEGPELAEEVHVHLPEADHLLPEEGQLGVQLSPLPAPARREAGGPHLGRVHVHPAGAAGAAHTGRLPGPLL